MSKNSRFKEAVTAIRSAVGEENAEERLDKVNRAIKNVERVESDYAEELNSATGESMGRKQDKIDLNKTIEQKDDKIQELEDKIKELDEDNALETMTAKRDDLQKYKDQVLKSNRETFVSSYKAISEHTDFEKLPEKLVVPESENGEELDWTKVSDDDIDKNLVKIRVARSHGMFGNIKDTDDTHRGDSQINKKKTDSGYFQDKDFQEKKE